MNKLTKREKFFFVLFAIFLFFLSFWFYKKGLFDDQLPKPIQERNISKKIEEVKNKIPILKSNEIQSKDNNEVIDEIVQNNILENGVFGGLNKVLNSDSNDNNLNQAKKQNKDNDEILKKYLNNPDYLIVDFKTTKGDFTVLLYKKLMPITVGNFERLVKRHFYDGIRFHRIVKDFIIQAGDPLTKDLSKKNLWGRGGPGYRIRDEFVKDPKLTNKKYTIAMANAGPNTGGSQFFINLKDNQFLDFDKPPFTSKHPVFGKVLTGFDTIKKIARSKNGEVIIKSINFIK